MAVSVRLTAADRVHILVRVRIDDISNRTLLLSCLFLALGTMMLARMAGNIYHGDASGLDLVIGIAGVVVLMAALMYPLKRIDAAARYFPDQKFSIYVRFIGISAFLFGIVFLLNAWAWSSHHSNTTSYSGPSHYVKDSFSRRHYADEIKARSSTGLSSTEIIGLRAIVTALSLGAFLMVFALLYQPYSTTGVRIDEDDLVSRDEVANNTLKALSAYAALLSFMNSKFMKTVGITILIVILYNQYTQRQQITEQSNKRTAEVEKLREKIQKRFGQYQIQPSPTENRVYVAAQGISAKKYGEDLHLKFEEILIEKHDALQTASFEGLGIWIYTSQPKPGNSFSGPVDKQISGMLTAENPSHILKDRTFIFPGKGAVCIRYNCKARIILGYQQPGMATSWVNTSIARLPMRVEKQGTIKSQSQVAERASPNAESLTALKDMIETDLGMNIDQLVRNRSRVNNAYCQYPARKDLWSCFLKAAKKALSDKKPSNAKDFHEAAIAHAYTTGQSTINADGMVNLLATLEAYADFLLTQQSYQARVKAMALALTTLDLLPGHGGLKAAQLHTRMSRTFLWSLDDLASAEQHINSALEIFDRLPDNDRPQAAETHKLMAELKLKQENVADAHKHARLAVDLHTSFKPEEPKLSAISGNSNADAYARILREYNNRLQEYERQHDHYAKFLDSIRLD